MTDQLYILEIHSKFTLALDSCEWADMLLRAYTKWCDYNGLSIKLITYQDNPEAGIEYAIALINGDASRLIQENGVHRRLAVSALLIAEPKVCSSTAIVWCYPVNEGSDIEVVTKYFGARPGGGGGSPPFIEAIASTGTLRRSLRSNGSDRHESEELLSLVLKSRPHPLDLMAFEIRRGWRLHPEFYGTLYPNGEITYDPFDFETYMQGGRMWGPVYA